MWRRFMGDAGNLSASQGGAACHRYLICAVPLALQSSLARHTSPNKRVSALYCYPLRRTECSMNRIVLLIIFSALLLIPNGCKAFMNFLKSDEELHPTCEAGGSIKPGVERSGTPGR